MQDSIFYGKLSIVENGLNPLQCRKAVCKVLIACFNLTVNPTSMFFFFICTIISQTVSYFFSVISNTTFFFNLSY